MKTEIRKILEEIEEPLTYEYPIGIDEDGYEKLINKVDALFSLHVVSKQRELLIAFWKHAHHEGLYNSNSDYEKDVDEFLSN